MPISISKIAVGMVPGSGLVQRLHPESAGISASLPEISRSASAQREVESAIIEKLYPWSLQYSASVIPV